MLTEMTYSTLLKKKRHRFPGRVIEWAVRLYKSNPEFSYRDVSLILGQMGVYVTHKTVYEWVNKFGERIPDVPIRWNPKMRWTLQERVVLCNGQKRIQYAAVSRRGETLLILMRSKRSEISARRALSEMLQKIYPF